MEAAAAATNSMQNTKTEITAGTVNSHSASIIEKEKILTIQSEQSFFEIFNKRKFKCSGVVIPDTIFVSGGGVMLSWYFYTKNPLPLTGSIKCNMVDDKAKETGVILKKNHERLTEELAYLTFYNCSLLAKFGINAFETEPLTKQETFHKLKDIFTHKMTNDELNHLRTLT